MARKPEQLLWDAFKRATESSAFDLRRIENYVGESIPDVIGKNFKGTVFWLENKALPVWPKRQTTIALRDKFQPGQIPFARSWNFRHGNAFILLRAELEWFIFKPLHTDALDLDEMTQSQLKDAAIVTGLPEIIKFLEDL